ncbi:PLU-1-like protein-domain-containing protein [Lipomyces tetrasporus]|uniref:PLU-1-like protein-domain-containing protein n=1 Tax=Lipomyces tetrasporus TaxID=54092 RepID=A0AAD7QX76_9ASCO|nr:PLU-1-like protein-domain-containing protein [Lipomyces tetrasporus]KAJ8101507.1 PLU-1-like protein-domain-containing protein [Lipomyces tetrasporus]
MIPEFAPVTVATSSSRLRSKAHIGHGLMPVPLTNHGIPSVTSRQRPRALPLDLQAVEGRRNIAQKPPPKKERMLGLQEAPTYYPSEDEFRDPFTYIASIANEGKEYGIIKVVPPDSWKPEFALDTERFWFKTRRQELNSMEGGTRANLNFLDQLHKFHKQRGVTLNKLPSVDRRPLDLYHLKKSVDMRGGFEVVCKKKQWAEIGRELGYSGKIMTSLSSSLKNSYQKYILPYEKYLINAKPLVQQQIAAEQGGPRTPVKRSRTLSANSSTESQSRMGSVSPHTDSVAHFVTVNDLKRLAPEGKDSHSPVKSEEDVEDVVMRDSVSRESSAAEESTPDRRSSKRLKTSPEVEQPPTVVGSNMVLHREIGAVKRMNRQVQSRKPGENCEVCGRGDGAMNMLLCDGCDAGYHLSCLKPQLKGIPDYDWFCDKCLVGTGEFGFEDGQVYNLRQFQEKAKNFKDHYYSGKMPIDPKTKKTREVTEDEIEAEFWRLVEDVNDTVEVEYGADIHSTIHGSGFPTIERNPLDPYSTDSWNLNIMPLHEKSLFRHIKTDVSGMTVPWLYVGMIFSTFCWHSEDHYTYSANYQHFGATKTWYGIPGADSDKFEDAMRKAVPELFEQQPDLLFQLVTMMSPRRLIEESVRCYAIDQHPGEFVITFPQAYHAGFNHGFNFNEAVNFAPADWEPYGKLGIEIYQDYRKLPVFSHDELLLTAAARDNSIETAIWLGPALASMQEQEMAMRDHIRHICPNIKEEYSSMDLPEADIQCAYCNTYCYLSQVLCPCTHNIVCLNHYDELCDCDRSSRILRMRIKDDELVGIVSKVRGRAHKPTEWHEKYLRLTTDSEKPTLRALRSLLAESERIPYPLPEAEQLRKTVEIANEWVDQVQNILARKQQHRRKHERAGRRGSVKANETEIESRKPEDLFKLLDDVEKMPFYTSEIDLLKERVEQMNDYTKLADHLLANPVENMDEYVALIETGIGLNLDVPQIAALETRYAQLQWKETVDDAQKTYIYLPELGALLVEGSKLGFDDTEPVFKKLLKAKVQGDAWERDVNNLLESEKLDYDHLESMYDEATTTSVSKATYDALEKVLVKHKEANEAITSFLEQASSENVKDRAPYREVRRVMDSLKDLPVKPSRAGELEKHIKVVDEWLRKGKKLFGKSNAPLHALRSHLDNVEKRNRNCFSLDDKPRVPAEPASHEPTPEPESESRFKNDSHREMFCICRLPESGLMIECEMCHEWYHNRCLKIPRGTIKDADYYTCPICDYRIRIYRDSDRPKLEDLEQWEQDSFTLPLCPDELNTLHSINVTARKFRNYLQQDVIPASISAPTDANTMRFYLRKLEGGDILLANETNYFRAETHNLAPVAPDPPPMIETSLSFRKPRATKKETSTTSSSMATPIPASEDVSLVVKDIPDTTMVLAPKDSSTSRVEPSPAAAPRPITKPIILAKNNPIRAFYQDDMDMNDTINVIDNRS